MTWGTLQLEPEVAGWVDGLADEDFARVMFYLDLLEDQGVLLDHRTRASCAGSSESFGSTWAPAGASGSATTWPAGDGSCCSPCS